MKTKESFVVSVSMLTISIILSIGCGYSAIQKWQGKIYTYIGNDLAFERKQDKEIIKYDADELKTTKKMVCMVESDYLSFIDTYVVTPAAKSPKDSGN